MKRFSDVFLNPGAWGGAIVYAVLIIIGATVAARVIRVVARRAMDRRIHLDRAVVQFMTQLAQVAVWIAALITFLHIIPALQKLGTALLAGVSVASVVIGLAAQNTLGNFIAGLSLVLYRPFEIDDVVTLAGPAGAVTGVIERLALGYTVIRTFDDRRLIVPNNTMASQVALTSNHAQLRNLVIVSAILLDGYPVDEMKQLLMDAAQAEPDVIAAVSVLTSPLEPPAMSLSLRLWCRWHAAGSLASKIIARVRQDAAKKGINVLLPVADSNSKEMHDDIGPGRP